MKTFIQGVILATAWTVSAQGNYEAMSDFGGGIGGYVNGTAGWSFRPTTQLEVTALGCFDYLLIPGQETIMVGLWDSNGSLLASNVTTLSSELVNQSRYESINPVYLDPTQTYLVGAYSTGGTILIAGVNPSEYGGFILLTPEIQLRGAAAGFGGFVVPVPPGEPSYTALIAPNFQYSVVPEPSSMALLILGGLLGLARWNAK